jgi:hypothetical protein
MSQSHSSHLLVKATGGKTPALTPHPDPVVQEEVENLAATIEPSTRADQEWLKKQCLRRDNYRCAVTGFLDRNERRKHPNLRQPGEFTAETECAHILPMSLGKFDERYEEQCTETATVWNALCRYFPDLEATGISSGNINIPENAITMISDVHRAFGRFQFSLDLLVSMHSLKLQCVSVLTLHKEGEENRYRIRIYQDFQEDRTTRDFPSNLEVHFTTPDATLLPLPSAVALRVHSIVAKILDQSGIAELYNKMLSEDEDFNNTRFLSSDGSTDSITLNNSISLRLYQKMYHLRPDFPQHQTQLTG